MLEYLMAWLLEISSAEGERHWTCSPSAPYGMGPGVTFLLSQKPIGAPDWNRAQITFSQEFVTEMGPEYMARFLQQEVEIATKQWQTKENAG